MILRADFGWVILVAFVFWLLQVLRAGATGRSLGGRGGPSPPPPPGTSGGTQREGGELEQLLRHLERRLGQAGAKTSQPPPKVIVKSPAPAQGRTKRSPAASPGEVVSLETIVDRAAEAEALERQRLAVAAARNRELGEADHAAFEAKIRTAAEPAAKPSAVTGAVTAQHLRDAVLWREILGPPKGLQ